MIITRVKWIRFHALLAVGILGLARYAVAQEQPGPQTSPPPPVPPSADRTADSPRPSKSEKVTVPAGTKFAVILQNGISTRGAKPGDSVYFQTAFPVTIANQIIIPVGCYVRGSILESKRPGKVKGRGEFRMRLEMLIFPNGYTVDLNAAPKSADSGGKETMDSEGTIQGASNKGGDVATVAKTTAAGAGIGAVADGGKGAGIGAGIGALAGLAAVLLTRGPEAELPRGSTLDIELEHALVLDADKIQFHSLGQTSMVPTPVSRQQ